MLLGISYTHPNSPWEQIVLHKNTKRGELPWRYTQLMDGKPRGHTDFAHWWEADQSLLEQGFVRTAVRCTPTTGGQA